MIKRFECTVSGRVQMVMFRDFTQRSARRLGLVGTVQNMPDGTVRVVAEGEEKMLLDLLEKLRVGPPFAKVERVDVVGKEATGEFTHFIIVYKNIWDRI
jgi:acylphosphatase